MNSFFQTLSAIALIIVLMSLELKPKPKSRRTAPVKLHQEFEDEQPIKQD
ncbi:hypothetical protein PPL_03673 [Heterostelium album PN500]|uniref:Uncharacterized protein n=1 Tax=Heterostelium pallidum (strain ATCC 26659 / Pp 5 / PN500) TaxID=670386 RepID=D3B6C5_HETP5|nr:hypothetical protein PPL_03673 [Heterostelium album PN500]EFA82895.1 hypothetical protein PPL_03673 [Heterostelium album PN500]|eukprot:XP_020435012.1 hypothetical protein PPL_03673 [Heterostelium album PN500]